MRRKSCNKVVAESTDNVDLTPMLDVVFIMLIFFVVSASFLKEHGVSLNQPDSAPDTTPSSQDNMVLILSSSNELSVDGRRVDVRSIRALVAQHMAEFPQGAVILRAHEQADAESYVKVADQVGMVAKARMSLAVFKDGEA